MDAGKHYINEKQSNGHELKKFGFVLNSDPFLKWAKGKGQA